MFVFVARNPSAQCVGEPTNGPPTLHIGFADHQTPAPTSHLYIYGRRGGGRNLMMNNCRRLNSLNQLMNHPNFQLYQSSAGTTGPFPRNLALSSLTRMPMGSSICYTDVRRSLRSHKGPAVRCNRRKADPNNPGRTPRSYTHTHTPTVRAERSGLGRAPRSDA